MKNILPLIFLMAMASKAPTPFLPCSDEIFWFAVRQAECNKKEKKYPRCVYMEDWGEESLGLYQLSVSDSKRHQNCPSDREKLLDPTLNEKCKNQIAADLIRDNQGNYSQVLGKYWSSLRSNKDWEQFHKTYPKHQGWNNFVNEAASRGCTIK